MKKVAFYLVIIVVPILFLLSIEGILRLFKYGADLSLFEKSKEFNGYYSINPNVGKRFFSYNNPTSPTNDIFLINKPANSFRVFVLGSSTTAGFPYEKNICFSRILYYKLKEALPEKNIEIVNVAMAAINSYAIADFIDEIIEQKPDAILIYAGHNEYYGTLGVASSDNGGSFRFVKKTHLALVHLRTYQLIQNLIVGINKKLKKKNVDITATLMERAAKDKTILLNSKQYYKGIEQYRKNMSEVLSKIKKNNIPVIISELVSNVKDLSPFQSIETNDLPKASDVYAQAKEELEKGNIEKAKDLFYYAKDLDVIKFRAPEDINKAILELAMEYNVPVLKLKSQFEKYSKYNIIGSELITEHLHPNIKGYYVMADAFFRSIVDNKILSISVIDTSQNIFNISYKKYIAYTQIDSLFGEITIKALKSGWPFKNDGSSNKFIYTYKPASFVDSLALLPVKYDNVTISLSHTEMAKYYISKGDIEKAFYEYLSLTHIYPYYEKYYLEAYDYASKLRNDSLVKLLFLPMPNLDSSFFALLKLSRIYQKEGNYNKAIKYYNKAIKSAKQGDNVIIAWEGLFQIYYSQGKKREALDAASHIKEIDPSYKPTTVMKEDVLVIVDNKVKPMLDNALKLARNGKINEALEILNESLKIQETAFAYQMIGSIMYQKKDTSVLYYLEKAYQLNPMDENTINNIVIVCLMQKKFAKAKEYLEKYKKIANKNNYEILLKSYNQALAKK